MCFPLVSRKRAARSSNGRQTEAFSSGVMKRQREEEEEDPRKLSTSRSRMWGGERDPTEARLERFVALRNLLRNWDPRKDRANVRPIESGGSETKMGLALLESRVSPSAGIFKVFCDGEDYHVADQDDAPVVRPWWAEYRIGSFVNRCVAERNSPHVSMQFAAAEGERAKTLASAFRVADCDPKVVVVYEAVLTESKSLAPNFRDWVDSFPRIDDRETQESVLAATFRTIFTIHALNRLGTRHNDPHSQNVLMGSVGTGRTRALAYFPDHAGAILLSTKGSEADVDRWITTCPASGFERLPHSPSRWIVQLLSRTFAIAVRGVALEGKSPRLMESAALLFLKDRLDREIASRSLSAEDPEAVATLVAGKKLALLGCHGCPWFVVRDPVDRPVAWPFLVDWDWGSRPRVFRPEGRTNEDSRPFVRPTQRDEGPFLNELASDMYPNVNNARTLDPKGDLFVFAASSWTLANDHPSMELVRRLWNETAPQLSIGLPGGPFDLTTNVLDRELPSLALHWQNTDNVYRFCPGPIEFETKDKSCSASMIFDARGNPRPCSEDPKEAGLWTLPDCAFLSPERLFATSKVLEGRPGGPLERRFVKPGGATFPPSSRATEVDAVFGDWMTRRSETLKQLCGLTNLVDLDRFVPDVDVSPA